MRLRPVVAVLAFVVASAPAGVAAPSAPSDYRAMVDDYRSGRKSALDAIGAANASEIDGWVELARSQGSSGLLRKTVNKGLADDFDQRTAPSFPANPTRQAAMRSFLLGSKPNAMRAQCSGRAISSARRASICASGRGRAR